MTALIVDPAPARNVAKTELIVPHRSASVKRPARLASKEPSELDQSPRRRRSRRKSRRQSHGSAWHWQQTDSWYYTLPGSKKRVPLFDEDGNRIRGIDNKKAASLALAQVKLGQGWRPEAPPVSSPGYSRFRKRTRML